MGSAGTFVVALSAVLLSSAAAVGAQEQQPPVLIYDYAVSHPIEDADLPSSPSIGASVPQTVELATIQDRADPFYGYFYYQGRPVIVDLTTRSVVRIDN